MIRIFFPYLEEDAFGSYARQLSKYFLAEGIVSSHAVFLASAEPEPSSILKVQITIVQITGPIIWGIKMNKFGFEERFARQWVREKSKNIFSVSVKKL